MKNTIKQIARNVAFLWKRQWSGDLNQRIPWQKVSLVTQPFKGFGCTWEPQLPYVALTNGILCVNFFNFLLKTHSHHLPFVDMTQVFDARYRTYFGLNYVILMMVGVCINTLNYLGSRQASSPTWYSVLTQVGVKENLRRVTGLYGRHQRTHLWAVVMKVHHLTLLLAVGILISFAILHPYLAFHDDSSSMTLKIVWCCLLLVVDYNVAFMGVNVILGYPLQIYFYTYRLDNICDALNDGSSQPQTRRYFCVTQRACFRTGTV